MLTRRSHQRPHPSVCRSLPARRTCRRNASTARAHAHRVPPGNRQWTSGFTLIELLTVVGIISLLIGILLPSLSRARDQARRVKVRATLAAIDKGLEMFQNDLRQYPRSDIHGDAIVDFPGAAPDVNAMWGSHSLARALVGPDLQGVDTELRMLKQGDLKENQITMADVRNMPRAGPYMDGVTLIRDTDPRWGEGDRHPPSGRPFVVDDAYEFPILYYKASPQKPKPFSDGDLQAVYNLWDNFGLTGISNDDRADSLWDFDKTGLDIPAHPLAHFGSEVPARINNPPPYYPKGKTFQGFLHNRAALDTGGVVRPVNPDRFVLIHPGADALWGTTDDLANFE